MSAETDITRLIVKISTTTGEAATVPSSDDHTDGTWTATDIYIGEALLNTADDILYYRTDNGIVQILLGGSDSGIYTRTVTLSSDDILAMGAGDTPIELVAADADGRAIEVISASWYYMIGSDTYSGDKVKIGVLNEVAQLSSSDALKTTTTRGGRFFQADLAATTDESAGVTPGSAIYVYTDANPSGGNGTMKVSITYRYITF